MVELKITIKTISCSKKRFGNEGFIIVYQSIHLATLIFFIFLNISIIQKYINTIFGNKKKPIFCTHISLMCIAENVITWQHSNYTFSKPTISICIHSILNLPFRDYKKIQTYDFLMLLKKVRFGNTASTFN